MKKIVSLTFFVFLSTQIFTQQLNVQFTTTTISNSEYQPYHIFAVWVVNSSNVYQKSLMVYARERIRYLEKWNSQTGGNTTDAITGATLGINKTHNISWNLKNIIGNTLPEGTYKLCMEITSNDFAGPYREIEFTVGPDDYTLNPADGSNFVNISITYTAPEVATTIRDNHTEDRLMKIYPNPANNDQLHVSLNLMQDSQTKISLVSLDGRIINFKRYELKNGENNVDISNQTVNLKSGQYILQVETNHYNIAKSLILK